MRALTIAAPAGARVWRRCLLRAGDERAPLAASALHAEDTDSPVTPAPPAAHQAARGPPPGWARSQAAGAAGPPSAALLLLARAAAHAAPRTASAAASAAAVGRCYSAGAAASPALGAAPVQPLRHNPLPPPHGSPEPKAAAGAAAAAAAAGAAFVREVEACGGGEGDLARFARAVARRPPGAQQQLVAGLTALLAAPPPPSGGGALEGPLLARALWVASRAAGCPEAEKRRLFEEAVPAAYSSLSSLGPPDLPRLLTAYATAGCYSQELLAASTEFAWDLLPRLGPGEITDLALAYAAAGHYDNDDDLWGGLADRAVARIAEFEPAQLAALLEAAAHIRFRHESLCSAALSAAAHAAPRWRTSHLCQVVWALGWLGHGVGPGEGPQLDRLAAAVTTRLRNLLTSTDASRVLPSGAGRLPGGEAAGNGGGAGGGGGFLGTSAEVAALAARGYSLRGGAGDAAPPQREQQPRPQQQQGAGRGQLRRPTLRLVGRPPPGAAAQEADSFVLRGAPPAAGAGAGGGGEEGPSAGAACVDSEADDGPDDCRPALEPPGALRESLPRLAWGLTALGRLPAALLRESFRLLGGYPPADYAPHQLAMLFEAGAAAAAMGQGAGDTHPLTATSARVLMAELKRAPRVPTVSPSLQAYAFAAWLRGTRGGAAPLCPPPLLAAARWRGCGAPAPWPPSPPPPFSHWRFRDPATTGRAAMEASLAACLATAGLAPAPPAAALTLDGVMAVPLPLARGNARLAVEPLPPEAAAANAPHTPLGAAAARRAMLRHRGWGVAGVPFTEWAGAREAGEGAVAEYLKAAADDAEAAALNSER
ncbi:MAG: hypothetical protein J3K34DRAFT_524697 [Monoraphidium minutum]|nr:MAG: hypothetical protein J3K34DRAFT_524697 [Monoraphidium minutum]